jgi:hypothetical protein
MCDCRRGFGSDIGFIDLLYTQLGTTSNFSAIANLDTLQIITARDKSFPVCCGSFSHSLVPASDSGDSPANAFKSSFHRLSYRTDLVAPIVFLITPWHGPSTKRRFQHYLYCCMRIRCRGNVFTEPFPSSGCLFLLIKTRLPSNQWCRGLKSSKRELAYRSSGYMPNTYSLCHNGDRRKWFYSVFLVEFYNILHLHLT